MTTKRLIWIALLCAAGLAVVLGLLSGGLGRRPKPAPFVSTLPPRDSGVWIAAPGRVEPVSEEIRLGFDLGGIIKSVLVDEGDRVTRGQVVAELVSDEYRNRLDSASATVKVRQAELEKTLTGGRIEEKKEALAQLLRTETVMSNAKVEAERRAALLEKGLIAKETADRANTDYQVARAEFEAMRQQSLLVAGSRKEDIAVAFANLELARAQELEAQSQLNRTELRSPVDGLVLKKHRTAGEAVSLFFDSPVLTVGDVSRLRLRADVDEKDIALVREGQKAYAAADAFGGKKFYGRVERVGSMLGRKNIRTEEPKERQDTKILEVLVALDDQTGLVTGLRMDTYILVSGETGSNSTGSAP